MTPEQLQEFKARVRQQAIDIETLAIPCAGCKDTAYIAMMDMANAVMVLTSDIEQIKYAIK
jgi:hypothetical protein